MITIGNLTVKTTYTVELRNIEVENEEYVSLMKAYKGGGNIASPGECKQELFPASAWLYDNIKEDDAIDWEHKIQEIGDNYLVTPSTATLKTLNTSKIEEVFGGLRRSEKATFISQNIDYANADAIAKYIRAYLFGILDDMGEDEHVATYLSERGYKVIKDNL